MSQLPVAVAAPIPFTFDGEDILVDPIDFRILGAAEIKLKQSLPTLEDMAAAIAKLDPTVQAGAFKDAVSEVKDPNRISSNQVFDWMFTTLEGFSYSLHLCLEKRYPGRFTLDRVYRLVEHMMMNERDKLEKLKKEHAEASGIQSDVPPDPTKLSVVRAPAQRTRKPRKKRGR